MTQVEGFGIIGFRVGGSGGLIPSGLEASAASGSRNHARFGFRVQAGTFELEMEMPKRV